LDRNGIRLVVVGSAGSPDTPDVQETLTLHTRATRKSLEDVLAESGSRPSNVPLPDSVPDHSFTSTPAALGWHTAITSQKECSTLTRGLAEYAILTIVGGRLGLEFRRVPVDVAALIAT
jgi:hypothetical protein